MNNINNYLITSKGFKIPIDDPNVDICKKELYIIPYTENPVRYPIFRISEKYMYLPKYYGISKFGIPPISNIKEQFGTSVNFLFNGKLRDYQIETCNTILKYLLIKQSGLANIYTGWGKTCGALWIASQLNLKTLIIVHTENLLNQWRERITDFLGIPAEEIGIIQGPNKTVENKKICIGMIQSISMKEYSNETFRDFGFSIFDEVHFTPSRVFSKIFYKIGTKYNLGLSATLVRKDGLTKVIKYFLGEVIVNLKLSILTPSIKLYYTNIEPLQEKTMINGKINMAGMINDLCDSFQRNLEIVKIIKEKYLENRKILVLTDRRNHCSDLKRLLGDNYSIGLYYGGMKNDALKESNKKRIIIATYQIASVGYDNPELDTLIFASPKTNIEQAIGRILRQENENEPEVIDIIDAWSIFNNLFFNRMKFYKRKKYIINGNKEKNKKEDTEIKLENYAFEENELN